MIQIRSTLTFGRHLHSRGFKSLSSLSSPKSTVNEAELSHFRQLSSKWWTSPEFLPLRNMNQLRVPFITTAFQSKFTNEKAKVIDNLTDAKLLDIGCGGGILSEALSRVGGNVTGIDPVDENVQAALHHATISFRHNLDRIPNYKCTNIEQLSADPANQGAFDGIIASEVLEHVDNIGLFLDSALKCLRPGGFFFLTTMNQTPLAYLSVILGGEYLTNLVPKGTHDYDKFVPPKALSLVLNDYNCDVVKVHGMFFNPLTLQWSWTQNQWVNYALMAVKRS